MIQKPNCVCGEPMAFLMDNKRQVMWECKKCHMLVLQPYNGNWQRRYQEVVTMADVQTPAQSMPDP